MSVIQSFSHLLIHRSCINATYIGTLFPSKCYQNIVHFVVAINLAVRHMPTLCGKTNVRKHKSFIVLKCADVRAG